MRKGIEAYLDKLFPDIDFDSAEIEAVKSIKSIDEKMKQLCLFASNKSSIEEQEPNLEPKYCNMVVDLSGLNSASQIKLLHTVFFLYSNIDNELSLPYTITVHASITQPLCSDEMCSIAKEYNFFLKDIEDSYSYHFCSMRYNSS